MKRKEVLFSPGFKFLAQVRSEELEALIKAGRSLININLEKAALKDANLRSANLRSANLRSANLSGANLEGANLKGANISGGNLESVNLKGANLRSANLKGSKLEAADLCGADLDGVNLKDADLERADLNRANLKDANLEDADLRSADLCGAKLNGANLKGANLKKANFRSREVSGVGVRIARLFNGQLLVSGIYQDTEALKAGIKPGDTIVTVNGKKTELMDIDEAKKLLFASAGSQVKLIIERDDEEKEYSLNSDRFRMSVLGLTSEQVKGADNWQKADYDPEFRASLGLPSRDTLVQVRYTH